MCRSRDEYMKTCSTIILTLIGIILYLLAVVFGNTTYNSYYTWTILPALAAISSIVIFSFLGYRELRNIPSINLNSYDATSLSNINLDIMTDQCALDASIANYHLVADLNVPYTPVSVPMCSYT